MTDSTTGALAADAPDNLIPMRYDIATDMLVPVTQGWVDGIGQLLSRFGIARAKARLAINLLDSPNAVMVKASLQAFLDAWKPEHEQKP